MATFRKNQAVQFANSATDLFDRPVSKHAELKVVRLGNENTSFDYVVKSIQSENIFYVSEGEIEPYQDDYIPMAREYDLFDPSMEDDFYHPSYDDTAESYPEWDV